MNIKKQIALACVVAFLSGCSQPAQPLTGQIFVVRQDRETIKLSGTRIYVGPKSIIGPQVDRVAAQRQAATTEIRELAQRILDTISEVETLEADEQKQRLARKTYSDTITRIQLQIKANGGQQTQSLVKRLQELETKKEGAWNSIREIESKVRAGREALALQEVRIHQLKGRLHSVPDLQIPTHEQIQSVVADAEGRFTLHLTSEEPMIVAQGVRRVLDQEEFYLWALPVQGQTNIMLSNENMLIQFTRFDENKGA